MFVEFQKIQFVQSWPHGQGIWGVEGGVRLQVIDFDKLFFFSFRAKFLAISFLFLSLLSFRAMFLIDSEGVVVAREVSLCISLTITFLTPIHASCPKFT